MADNLEATKFSPEVGPWQVMEYITNLESTRLVLKMFFTPEALRDRARRLRKSKRDHGTGETENRRECTKYARWKPTHRRPPYSEKIALELSEDDPSNDENYKALYGINTT